ncbi:MAG TPA: PaaI family thioesterase [Mycobacterium sp.]
MTAQRSDTVAEDWGESRSRVVTWHDPAPSTARGLAMAGLDYLRAMIDGTLPPPPICQLMRYDIVSAESGRVVFTCEPDESAYNGTGVVHGGLVCTLLDSVAALALHSTLPQGRGCTSVEIKVNYLKAVRLGSGLLTATGTVIKAGSRIAFTEGVVSAASGTVVATASSTLAVFDL